MYIYIVTTKLLFQVILTAFVVTHPSVRHLVELSNEELFVLRTSFKMRKYMCCLMIIKIRINFFLNIFIELSDFLKSWIYMQHVGSAYIYIWMKIWQSFWKSGNIFRCCSSDTQLITQFYKLWFIFFTLFWYSRTMV